LIIDRRRFFGAGAAGLAAAFARPALAAGPAANPALSTDAGILGAVKKALARHAGRIAKTDIVAVADFSAPSRRARFFLIDMTTGRRSSFLVAHGRGSDPDHTGWVRKFSNEFGSNASSAGAYRTGEFYVGKHGRSMRLDGLDPENSNAAARAIVMHGAWYVGADMIRQHGKLGRSEGCFAFAASDLDHVLDRLGAGRLLLAGKF
jgi:hypothetical protein